MLTAVRSFWFPIITTIGVIVASINWLGWAALLPLLILIIIEVTFSFDNAVVNAKVLEKMSRFWQILFLSVGIIIAVFAMRLIFPILIVAVTSVLSWHDVVDLALTQPQVYETKLQAAHPTITAFGGAFLLMLSLHFFTTENRRHVWLKKIEQPLAKLDYWWTPSLITLVVLTLISIFPINHHGQQTFVAGLFGLGLYLLIHGLTMFIDRSRHKQDSVAHYTGSLAFLMFIYLEILDASFSLDAVLGAFAITSDVVLIAAGLGVGAVWVRSMTVFMVRRGTLRSYRFLENGAFWAIGVLAASMLLSNWFDISEIIIGLIGVSFIGAAIASSIKYRKIKVV